jgi:hypothetical protein
MKPWRPPTEKKCYARVCFTNVEFILTTAVLDEEGYWNEDYG